MRAGSWPTSSAREGHPDDQGRDVRRDHAPAGPARIRAPAPVADALGHVRRRRSQRRGQPCAVRSRELVSHAAAPATRSATPPSPRCAPRACAPTRSCAAAIAWASTSRRRARASARRRSSTTARTRQSGTSRPRAVDWARVLQHAAWFHVTGITPALGATAAGATRAAVDAARAAGAKVSIDLNYRKKLWSPARGASRDASAHDRRRCGDRQRGRSADRARRPGRRTRT